MTQLNDLPPFPLLQFYATAPYGCSYLPGRIARSQVATPTHLIDQDTYSELVRNGFRRSGVFTYRPHCDTCHECQPVRVPVKQFQPNRTQRYQAARHQGGGMDQDSRDQYAHFLLQSHVSSRLIEFRENDVLRMISIIDLLSDGMSSVYTFYDPDCINASFGTYSILWQIGECQHLNLDYLYLGYWIQNSRKMTYKTNYRPLEVLRQGQWRLLDVTES